MERCDIPPKKIDQLRKIKNDIIQIVNSMSSTTQAPLSDISFHINDNDEHIFDDLSYLAFRLDELKYIKNFTKPGSFVHKKLNSLINDLATYLEIDFMDVDDLLQKLRNYHGYIRSPSSVVSVLIDIIENNYHDFV